MKKLLSLAITICMALTLVVGTPTTYFGVGNSVTAAATKYETGYYKVTTQDGLNLRVSAKSDAKVSTVLPYGAKIKVSKVDESWGYTAFAGRTGWIKLKYTSYYGKKKPGVYKIKPDSGLNMRKKADKKSTVLATIPGGKEIKITKSSEGWGKTSYKGKSGWVKMSYLTLIEDSLDNPYTLLPADIEVDTLSYSSLKVTWPKISDATGYYIYRSNEENENFKKIETVTSPGIVSVKDKGLKRNTAYYYKIETYRDGVNNVKKNSETKGVCGFTGSEATKIVSIKSKSETSAQIKWEKPSYATGYVLYRGTDKDGKYSRVGEFGISKTSYTNKKLKTNTKYYYKIRSTRQIGKKLYYSEKSEPESVTVKPIPSKITTSNLSIPTGTMMRGTTFALKGTVKSNHPIEKIMIGIKNSSKKWMDSYTETCKPNTTSYNVSKVDNDIQFDKLGEGTYYYAIFARDSKGYSKTLCCEKFKIKVASDSTGDYRWPVKKPITISCYFQGQYPAHQGIDIAKSEGAAIYAAKAGYVQIAQDSWQNVTGSYGKYVRLLHDDGWGTLYAHCSKVLVSAGQYVKKGTKIAEVGNTGYSFGNHLHFEIIKPGNTRVNPLNYLP